MFTDISQRLEQQRAFFDTNRTIDIKFRKEALKKLRNAIKINEKKIIDALYNDLRKHEFEAYTNEISIVVNEISYHLKNLRCWSKNKRVRTNLANVFASNHISSDPHGVVLIMSPWNYPFQLLLNPLVGAISAGNCAILKPAEFAVHTSAVIADIISEIFPPEYISLFKGGKDVNQALLKEKFDYIFFTGSPVLGKIVMQAASEHLTPVTLELGGKNPCIVNDCANIEVSAKRIAWGKFLNNGQTCISPDYLLVHESVKNELITQLQKHIKAFYGSNPADSQSYGRIINKHHFDRLVKLINSSSVVFGGGYNADDLYIEPTILDKVSLSDAIMQEEIFGPLLPILEYKSVDEAMQIINSNQSPLAFYIFADKKSFINNIINKIKAGGICINDTVMNFVNHRLPFGGSGNSGMGQYHGKYSFDTFSRKRAILKQPTIIDIPLRYPPFSKWQLKFIKKIL